MKKILIPIFTFATAALFVSGCASHEGAYMPKNTGANQENESKFVLLDPGAQRSVTCTGIQNRTTPDGRLEVIANVLNRENRRIQVQMNCVFKDEQFFPLDESEWKDVILTENETKGVVFQSGNAKARNYTIRVRQAR